MSYKHNTRHTAIPLDFLVNAVKTCLRQTVPNEAEVSANFDLLYVQELFRLEHLRSELYASNKIQLTLTDKLTSLCKLVENLDFPIMMKELFKSILDQIETSEKKIETSEKKITSGKRKNKSGNAERIRNNMASKSTCKNQKSFDIEQIIEKQIPPIKQKKIGSVNLEKSVFSKKLDKIQRRNLKTELDKVQIKYSHYTQCQGCTLCDLAFKRLNVTYCSKKHGGPACNSLGLYPHATATYLSVLHSTKKFVGTTQGFENPLVEEEVATPMTVEQTAPDTAFNENPVNLSTQHKPIVENCAPRNFAPISEHQQRMLSIADRQMYAKKWKLTSESTDSDYLEALELMTKLKKRYPNYVPPQWATITSTVLFESMNIDAAKRTAMYHRPRYLSKKAKRIQRAINRAARR